MKSKKSYIVYHLIGKGIKSKSPDFILIPAGPAKNWTSFEKMGKKYIKILYGKTFKEIKTKFGKGFLNDKTNELTKLYDKANPKEKKIIKGFNNYGTISKINIVLRKEAYECYKFVDPNSSEAIPYIQSTTQSPVQPPVVQPPVVQPPVVQPPVVVQPVVQPPVQPVSTKTKPPKTKTLTNPDYILQRTNVKVRNGRIIKEIDLYLGKSKSEIENLKGKAYLKKIINKKNKIGKIYKFVNPNTLPTKITDSIIDEEKTEEILIETKEPTKQLNSYSSFKEAIIPKKFEDEKLSPDDYLKIIVDFYKNKNKKNNEYAEIYKKWKKDKNNPNLIKKLNKLLPDRLKNKELKYYNSINNSLMKSLLNTIPGDYLKSYPYIVRNKF